MVLFIIFIVFSITVIGLVVYSALVISSKQDQIAQRLREENRFKRASANGLALEASEELANVGDETSEIDEIGEIVFNFKKPDSQR